MNKLAKFIAGVGIGATLATAPVQANEIEQHQQLWDALEMVGVKVVINHPEDCDGKVDGIYDSVRGYITICQDLATDALQMVGWTDNDLDTLRHEAQHVVQDCVGDRLGDGYLAPMFRDQETREQFVIKSIGAAAAKRIVFTYRGAGMEVVNNELEAFAVANAVNATSISDAVIELCTP